MDPQSTFTNTPSTPIESPKKDSSGITIAAMAIFVLLALGAVAFLYYQNQQLKTMIASYQTPTTSPTPTATPDITANWSSFPVPSDGGANLTGITYKLPANVTGPEWVNAGHYYQTISLPGNTVVGVYFIGKGQGFAFSYDQFISQIITKFDLTSRPASISNFSGLEFTGTIGTKPASQDLLILGEGQSQFRGVIVKVDSNNSLYLLHYQPVPIKNVVSPSPEQIDYSSDDKLFDQILSTFKFLNQPITKEQAASLVTDLPEVKNYLANTPNGKVALDSENKTTNSWIIHVYEDFPDHQATFGWYSVNEVTGAVTKTS